MANGVEAHWQFLIEHECAIRRIFRNISPYLADELWSEVALVRIERIIELYDPEHESKAALKTYVFTNLYLYAKKYVARQKNLARRNVELQDYFGEVTDNNNRELVNTLLSKLPRFQAAVLFMRHYEELGFLEMGQRLGVKRGMARVYYQDALKAARVYLKGQGIGSPQ